MLRAVLLLLCLGQDDVRGLIEKLEDDSFEVRDRAQKDLVKLGEAAVPALRTFVDEARASKDRGELLLRAEAALREIELAAKSKAVCPDAPLFDFKALSKLGELGDAIEAKTKLPVEYGAPGRAQAITVAATSAPLMKILDDACRGQEALTWEWNDGKVLFKAEPHLARPSSYSGAFRVRLASLRLTRSTDFKVRSSVLACALEADHDPTVKPSRDRDLELIRATDDKGTLLEIRQGDDPEDGQQQQVFNRFRINRALRAGIVTQTAPSLWSLKGLPADARKVSLYGQVRFRFPLDRADVKIENPQGGESRELGDYTVRLDASNNKRWTLSFRKTKGSTSPQAFEEILRRLDAEAAVAIDEDGMEHRGTLAPAPDTMAANIVIVNGQVQETVDALGFLFQFPTLKAKAIKELRFRFADKLFEKLVPFALEDVELP